MLAGAVPDVELRPIHGESADAVQFSVPVPAFVTAMLWLGGFIAVAAKKVSDDG